MALQFSGSGQYLIQNVPLITQYPATFACWYKATSVAASRALLSVGASGSNNSFLMAFAPNMLRAETIATGTAVFAATTATITAGVWSHCAAVFTSATSRTAYLNGVPVSNATSNTPTGVNLTCLAGLIEGSTVPTITALGAIAFPAIWNIALTQSDINSLQAAPFNWTNSGITFNWTNSGGAFSWTASALGSDPRKVETPNLVSFSLLAGPPYPDAFSGNDWTVTGAPTLVADPFPLVQNTIQLMGNTATGGSTTIRRTLRPLHNLRF